MPIAHTIIIAGLFIVIGIQMYNTVQLDKMSKLAYVP